MYCWFRLFSFWKSVLWKRWIYKAHCIATHFYDCKVHGHSYRVVYLQENISSRDEKGAIHVLISSFKDCAGCLHSECLEFLIKLQVNELPPHLEYKCKVSLYTNFVTMWLNVASCHIIKVFLCMVSHTYGSIQFIGIRLLNIILDFRPISATGFCFCEHECTLIGLFISYAKPLSCTKTAFICNSQLYSVLSRMISLSPLSTILILSCISL